MTRRRTRVYVDIIARSTAAFSGYAARFCGRQGSHDFIVHLGITHVPMDTANVRPKRACRVMDLRSQAALRFDVRSTSPWTIGGVLHPGDPTGPRTKALRVVAWSTAPRLRSRRKLIY